MIHGNWISSLFLFFAFFRSKTVVIFCCIHTVFYTYIVHRFTSIGPKTGSFFLVNDNNSTMTQTLYTCMFSNTCKYPRATTVLRCYVCTLWKWGESFSPVVISHGIIQCQGLEVKWLNVVGDLRRFLPTWPQIYAGKAIKAYINNIYIMFFSTVDVSIYTRILPLGASLHWSQIHPYTLSLTYIMYLHLSLLILSFEGFILFLFPSHFWLKSFQWTVSLEVCNPSIWTFPATLHMSQGHNWVHTWSNMRTISILDASFVPRQKAAGQLGSTQMAPPFPWRFFWGALLFFPSEDEDITSWLYMQS